MTDDEAKAAMNLDDDNDAILPPEGVAPALDGLRSSLVNKWKELNKPVEPNTTQEKSTWDAETIPTESQK